MQFFFNVCQVECYVKILKLSYRPLAPTSYKDFLKNKKRSRTNLSVSFSPRPLTHKIPFFGCLFFMKYDIIKCEINLILLINKFFLQGQNVRAKLK